MMQTIEKILFPTDFSPHADRAFPWAVELALTYGAELHVFHGFVLGSVLDETAAEALDDLEHLASRLDRSARARLDKVAVSPAHDVRIRRVTRRGLSAATLIRNYSDDEDIDLTVMGTHGRRSAAQVLLGSVTEEVVRTSSNAVLTVRERESESSPSTLERILVPLDLSRNSLLALPYAKSLAASYGARLQLLHVVEPITYPSFYALKQSQLGSLLGDVEKQAREELVRAAEAAGGPSVPLDAYVVQGQAVTGIVDFAETKRSDLVVVTTHGLTGLKRLLIGSVAEKVVRRASAPVLVVKVESPTSSDASR